jgi:hypothetical protein
MLLKWTGGDGKKLIRDLNFELQLFGSWKPETEREVRHGGSGHG